MLYGVAQFKNIAVVGVGHPPVDISIRSMPSSGRNHLMTSVLYSLAA
jgi:hypothetical protein